MLFFWMKYSRPHLRGCLCCLKIARGPGLPEWPGLLCFKPGLPKSYAIVCQSLTQHVVDVQKICLKCVPLIHFKYIQSLHCRFPGGQIEGCEMLFCPEFLTDSARIFAKNPPKSARDRSALICVQEHLHVGSFGILNGQKAK